MTETTSNKVYWVKGNTQPFIIPLEQEVMTEQDEIVAEPYYPDGNADIVVNFVGKWMKYPYIPRVDGNLLIFTVNATMPAGNYDVEIVVKNQDGTQYRSQWDNQVVITNSNPSVLREWDEFKQQDVTARAALFFFAKGDTGVGIAQGGSMGQVLVKKSNTDYDTEWQDAPAEQIQSDWNQTDQSAKDFIKNKPTNLVEDESYVHTDNNYTDEEKEKLADLENYDDSGIRQELDSKVDKVDGKGLSTNDYTDEDKSKLNSALQTETDPTVPSWAKQSTKPSYTPQEVGALPANTPLFDGDYNSLVNKPDLSGFITISVNNLANYYLKSETYTKQEVQALIAAIQQFHYEIYASTSEVTSPQGNVLYLIGPTGTGADKYEEYVYADSQFVKIGDTSIDLSGYYTSQQTDSAITQALNAALAGYTTTEALTLLLAGKQDVINDLSAIRSGAAAGATAYQKPQGGIPSTDMSQGVQTSLGKADSSLQPTQQTLTNEQKQQARNNIGAAGVDDVPTLPNNVSYFSGDSGEGIVPTDGIRAETVTSASTMTVNPDVVTVINGAVGTATITLQVPQDSLAHVWDILLTTDSSVAITFAMSNSATILYPDGFSVGASKAVEISVIGVGTKYYLRYGEFA